MRVYPGLSRNHDCRLNVMKPLSVYTLRCLRHFSGEKSVGRMIRDSMLTRISSAFTLRPNACQRLSAAILSRRSSAIVQALVRPDMNDLADVADLGREEADQFAEEFLLERQGLALVQREPFEQRAAA